MLRQKLSPSYIVAIGNNYRMSKEATKSSPRPQATPEQPKPVVDARAGREPTLTLFDNKTGQRKISKWKIILLA